jgi:hypothetical protein
MLREFAMYARFLSRLPHFLTRQITPKDGSAYIAVGLANRGARFLHIARRSIYGNPRSPYLPLLRNAGCEAGDLERMVRHAGLEDTLGSLADAGVRITVDEYKGRAPIDRDQMKMEHTEHDFDNPASDKHIEARTGGSRSAGTRTVFDLDFLAANWVCHIAVMLESIGAYSFPYGIWYPILPGAGPLVALCYAKAGKSPTRWFSPIKARDINPDLKTQVATKVLVAASRLGGVAMPFPEFVALDDAVIVARWVHQMIRTHGGCVLNTYPGAAVRVCQAATKNGWDLSGLTILSAGEPMTDAKVDEMTRVGARLMPIYSAIDVGCIGFGCHNPVSCDEIHFFSDDFAIIQRQREVPHSKATVDSLLLTSLCPLSPKVLLNVETGDYGVIERRVCGCPWEKLGFDHHMHTIRAFDKLTSAGMTFIGTDLLRVIEEVLPARFGGAPTDYQMVEEEEDGGLTRMSVVVSPQLGQIDEKELKRIILEALSRGTVAHRMMAKMWQSSGTLRIVRERPEATAAGKLLPLHIKRSGSE